MIIFRQMQIKVSQFYDKVRGKITESIRERNRTKELHDWFRNAQKDAYSKDYRLNYLYGRFKMLNEAIEDNPQAQLAMMYIMSDLHRHIKDEKLYLAISKAYEDSKPDGWQVKVKDPMPGSFRYKFAKKQGHIGEDGKLIRDSRGYPMGFPGYKPD